MRSIIYGTLLLGIGVIWNITDVSAQQSDVVEHPKFAVKWSPLHLIYFYPSAQVAIEHRIFKRLNVQYDAGLILNYGNSERFKNKEGYRLIGELRYYFPSPPKIPMYVAAEYYHAAINFDRFEVFGRGCESGDCDYFEYTEYRVEHTNSGVGVKAGIVLFPAWNKNRSFFFDFNVGIASRDIRYRYIGKPSGPDVRYYGDDEDPSLFDPDENPQLRLRLVLGVRVCYRFF